MTQSTVDRSDSDESLRNGGTLTDESRSGAARPARSPRNKTPASAGDDAGKRASPPSKRKILIVVALIVLVLAAVGTAYWLWARHYESTDDAFIDGHVTPISPQIAARVMAVHVDDNQLVHVGDVMVELDPTDQQVGLAQAQASLAAAEGKLQQAKAGVESARADREQAVAAQSVAQANFENADRDLKRYNALDERAKSAQQQDNAVSAQKTAAAQVAQAQAKVKSAESNIVTSQAMVTAAEGDVARGKADVHRAEVNLGYCKIVAPVDGRVTRKNVNVGAYVTSADSLFALVPAQVWVVANFKETQLDLMRIGQPVRIKVDAYPDQDFTGKIDSFQAGTGSRFSMIPAENATGNYVKVVQRVPVKITFDGDANGDNAHLLAPGMSVEPRVTVR